MEDSDPEKSANKIAHKYEEILRAQDEFIKLKIIFFFFWSIKKKIFLKKGIYKKGFKHY